RNACQPSTQARKLTWFVRTPFAQRGDQLLVFVVARLHEQVRDGRMRKPVERGHLGRLSFTFVFSYDCCNPFKSLLIGRGVWQEITRGAQRKSAQSFQLAPNLDSRTRVLAGNIEYQQQP